MNYCNIVFIQEIQPSNMMYLLHSHPVIMYHSFVHNLLWSVVDHKRDRVFLIFVEVKLHTAITSALDIAEWLISRSRYPLSIG